jgi:hypothetical protein
MQAVMHDITALLTMAMAMRQPNPEAIWYIESALPAG